jgi:hypothetical protein
MTCRHADNDPACGGYEGRVADARKLVKEYEDRRGQKPQPDPNTYEVKEAHEVADHLCLRVEYPNTSGIDKTKVLVFLKTSAADALRWKEIDPFFRDPKDKPVRRAPSPNAMFPSTEEGWQDAIEYAKSKVVEHVMES